VRKDFNVAHPFGPGEGSLLPFRWKFPQAFKLKMWCCRAMVLAADHFVHAGGEAKEFSLQSRLMKHFRKPLSPFSCFNVHNHCNNHH
jgi:hypothetical protein